MLCHQTSSCLEFYLKDALCPLVRGRPESHPLGHIWFQFNCSYRQPDKSHFKLVPCCAFLPQDFLQSAASPSGAWGAKPPRDMLKPKEAGVSWSMFQSSEGQCSGSFYRVPQLGLPWREPVPVIISSFLSHSPRPVPVASSQIIYPH